MHHRSKTSFDTVEKARDMKEYQDMKLRDISEILGVPYYTVVDWCFYRTRVNR